MGVDTQRLSKARLAEMRASLEDWRSPQEMETVVEAMMDEVGSERLFNQAGLSFLRDAWVAGKFAKSTAGGSVRLAAGDWPDFEVCTTGGEVLLFESTEALDPRRRRGQEYRENIGVRDDPFEQWIDRVKRAPDWLRNVSTRKATKGYPAKANLVIYLNMTEYGVRQLEVKQAFKDATSVAATKFVSVWVLWQENAHKVWPAS